MAKRRRSTSRAVAAIAEEVYADEVAKAEKVKVNLDKKEGKGKGVTYEDIVRRNEYIIDLSVKGLGIRSIWKMVNAKSEENGWGVLKNEGSISVIISKYYKSDRRVKNLSEQDEGEQIAHYEKMSKLLEDAVLRFAQERKTMTSKDFFRAVEVIGRLQQDMADNRNWNASKRNPLIEINQTANFLQLEEKATNEAVSNGIDDTVRKIQEKIKERRLEKEKEKEEDIIDAEVIAQN